MKTLIIEQKANLSTITINRAQEKNSINILLLQEICEALDQAAKQPECLALIFQGNEEIFCSGLDLKEVANAFSDEAAIDRLCQLYMQTIRKLATFPKLVISKVSGKVLGGGHGILAVSDFVCAAPTASFKLSEAFWGLIPAMVAPFLIRRIGYQNSLNMSLTGRTLSAFEANEWHLVDTIIENLDESIENFFATFKIPQESIKQTKTYFNTICPIDPATEQQAIATTAALLKSKAVQTRILNYLADGTLPWKQ